MHKLEYQHSVSYIAVLWKGSIYKSIIREVCYLALTEYIFWGTYAFITKYVLSKCIKGFSSIHAHAKIVNEYDQEIPQSQTTDNPVAPRGRAAQPSQDTRKTN